MIRALCKNEFTKLFSQRYPFLLFGAVLLLQAVRMLSAALTPPETTLEILSAPQLWADGVSMGLRFGTYLLLVIGAMSFSQEFGLGTAKTVLVLPLQRWHWAVAKLGFLVVVALAMLAAIVLMAIVIVAVTLGWGAVVREEVEMYSHVVVWIEVARAVGLTALFLLPVCTFALLIGVYFSSSGAAVGTALLLGIGLEAAVGLSGAGKYLFLYHLHRPVAMLEKLGKGLPFQWDDLLTWGVGTTIVSFLVLGGWLITRLEKMDVAT